MQAGSVVQVQPVPLIAVMVSPDGGVSITVTRLPAGLAPTPPLLTVTVYAAPVCPWVKLPVCVFAIVRSGKSMVVESLALLLPVSDSVATVDTAILLTCGDVALAATVTVTVSAG